MATRVASSLTKPHRFFVSLEVVVCLGSTPCQHTGTWTG
uniref:Uncharacterized protein n=1 Tax=Anguilla anguilla TaxID=7936 RepID=A0A0E9XAE3_ANGAN